MNFTFEVFDGLLIDTKIPPCLIRKNRVYPPGCVADNSPRKDLSDLDAPDRWIDGATLKRILRKICGESILKIKIFDQNSLVRCLDNTIYKLLA